MRTPVRALSKWPPAVKQRFRSVSLFVAIAWTIALSFRLIGGGLMNLVTFAVDHGWLESMVIDHGPSQCKEVPLLPATPLLPAQAARAAAWQLGMGFGMTAASSNAGTLTLEAAQQLSGETAQLAAALGVPAPNVQTPESQANAFVEYSSFVRRDPQCVATALRQRYTQDQQALYQFGAVMGFVVVTRSLVPQMHPPFVPELRSYARLAGVPQPIVESLTAELAGLTAATVQARLSGAVAALQQWLVR